MTEDETIKFAMWLTGHNEKTVRQLLSDWQKYHQDENDSPSPQNPKEE